MSKPIEMIGNKYGRLTVISKAESNKHGQTQHLCRCDCGYEKVFQSAHVRNGASLSCGCLRKEITSSRNKELIKTHGLCKTPEYRIWGGMHARCSIDHPKNSAHFGRGIKVCKRWSKFENFIADMGNKPTRFHSIDRINNDGNYEPSNCRWATRKEQSINTRCNIFLIHNGERKTLSEWADIFGINRSTFYWRYNHGFRGDKLFRLAVA